MVIIIVTVLFYICFLICFNTSVLSTDGFLIITAMYGLFLPYFYEMSIEEEEE